MTARHRFRLLFSTRRGWLFLAGVAAGLAVGHALLPAGWSPVLPVLVLVATAIWLSSQEGDN